MASKTNRSPIPISGLQISNRPSDKLGPGNSLIMDNWRVDQDGQLKARYGSGLEAGPIGSGTFHTLKRTDNNRYGGIGTGFYYGTFLQNQIVSGLDGNPCGVAFYRGFGWLMNQAKQRKFLGNLTRQWGVPACPAACKATGGGAITKLIDEYQDGSNGLTVGLTSQTQGPTNQFTNYAMQNGVPVVGDTDGSNICVAVFDPNTVSPNSAATASLALGFNGQVGATAYFTGLGIDTTVDGQVQDQDYFQVNIQCSDPTQIVSLTVYVKTGTTGYAEWTTTNPQAFLSQGLNTWTQLKIFRRLNLDNFSAQISAAAANNDQQTVSDLEARFSTLIQSPTFIYQGSGWPQTGIGAPPPSTFPPSPQALAIDWTNITDFGVSVQVAAACFVNIDEATVVSAVNNNSTGAINYFVSFANNENEDGIPGPASNPIVGGPQQITLTGIPVSSSPDVTQRYLWKIGGGLSQAYQVGILPDNSTTTFVDTTTNAQLQADAIVMPGTLAQDSRDLPPPAKGCLGPVFGKIIAFNTVAHPARYWWTNSAQPWFFPNALDEFIGNWEDAGNDDDPIIQATDHKQLIILYKNRSIWRLPGDPAVVDVVKTNSNIGLVGPNAVVNGGLVDYLVGPEGVYSFNGDFETKISQEIDAIFKNDFTQLTDGDILPPLNTASIATCALSLINDRLRLSYPESGTGNNVVAVYHIPTGRWSREKYNLAAPAFSVMNYEGPGALLMAGATGPGSGGGYLYHLESGYQDNGSAYHAVWQSAYYDQGLPDNLKVYTDIEVDCQTLQGQSAPTTLTVFLVLDNGTKIQIGTLQSSNAGKPRFTGILPVMDLNGVDIGRRGKNAAVRIEADVQGVVIIFGVYLHWYPEERIALTWDTGPTDFGIPERCKEVDYLEFYMQASGQSLPKILYSDLPGSILTSRDTAAFTAPNGRGNVRFRLASPIDGRNFRLWCGNNPAGGTFQLFNARARMRPIGEYIDGTIGEYFESPEFSVAPGRAGELKDLLLDYDCTGGNGSIVIYTDLPGNALTQQTTLPLPAQSRAPRVLPFEVPTLLSGGGPSTVLPYGQLFKIRIYPPAGGILRLHGRAQLRARIIGVYFDGTRNEIWETQPLDLFGGMAVMREAKIICQTTGPMTLEVRTELPGQDMRTVAQIPVNPTSSTAFRLPITGRLPGTAKGNLQQFRLVGPYIARIFEVQVLGRRVQLSDGPWDWVNVPMEATPNEWANIQIPVRVTPEEFTWIDMSPDPIE